MKSQTLLLVGAAVLAAMALSKKSSGSDGDSLGGGGYDIGGYPSGGPLMPDIPGNQSPMAPMQKTVNPNMMSIDLAPVAATSPGRFVPVSYDGGKSSGFLDRAQQQSITTQEAAKRNANPFKGGIVTASTPPPPPKPPQKQPKTWAKPNVFGI